MSDDIHALAKHISNLGTGDDSMLVHMSKGEFKKLQKTTGMKGGKNPVTGLPAFDPDLNMGGDSGVGGMSPEGDSSGLDTAGDSSSGVQSDSTSTDNADAEASAKVAAAGKRGDTKAGRTGKDDYMKDMNLASQNALLKQMQTQQKQIDQLSKAVTQQNQPKMTESQKLVSGATNIAGFLGDNLIGKEFGKSVRDAGKFIQELPKQLTSLFTASAEDKAQRTSASILNAAMPNLTKSLWSKPSGYETSSPIDFAAAARAPNYEGQGIRNNIRAINDAASIFNLADSKD